METQALYPMLHPQGGRLVLNSLMPATQVDVHPFATPNDENNHIISSYDTITIDLQSVGANGLDEGEVEPSTWYSIWGLDDIDGKHSSAGVASKSPYNPHMPLGYERKKRLGWVRTDASGNLRDIPQCTISGGYRVYTYENDPIASAVEGRVALPSPLPLDWTTIDLSEVLPPTSENLYLLTRNVMGITSVEYRWRAVGATDDSPSQRRIVNGSHIEFLQNNHEVGWLHCPGQQIEFKMSAADQTPQSLWYPLRFVDII